MTDNKTPSPETHVAVLLDAEDGLKREFMNQLARFVHDLEHLPVDDVAVQDLFAKHLSGCQNGFVVGNIIAEKLGSFGILTESTVLSDMKIIAGHDADSVFYRTSVRAVGSARHHPNAPVAYRHRLTGFPDWNVSNADDMDGVRDCMRHLGDRLEVEPLFAATAPQDHVQDIDWFETCLNVVHEHKKTYVVTRDDLKQRGKANAALYANFVEVCDSISQAIHDLKAMPAPSPSPETNVRGELHPDDLAIDQFAAAMKAKLAEKRDEGRSGWDDKDDCSQLFLSQLLREHVEKGDFLDVGNFAMMLHQRDERISSLLETLQGD
jgi:hypothetical protein